jgi:hypothetical protein
VASFEYRLSDESKGYPVLFQYQNIDPVEAAMRFICDYFVKENKTYLKTASAIEAPNYVMYVEETEDDAAEDTNAQNAMPPQGIAVEVRRYQDGATHYPIIHQFGFNSQIEAFTYLLADTMILFGQEYEKTSAEVDEDRQAFVYYCQPVKGG